MRREWLTPAAVVCAVTLITACSDSRPPTAPQAPEPQPGWLMLRLDPPVPNGDDTAVVIRITGPGPLTEVSVPAGRSHLAFHRSSGSTLNVAVFGTIAAGDLVRFSVPDVHGVNRYQATLVEAAGPDNQLRSSNAGYVLHLRVAQ
jgi:hypothetical protein